MLFDIVILCHAMDPLELEQVYTAFYTTSSTLVLLRANIAEKASRELLKMSHRPAKERQAYLKLSILKPQPTHPLDRTTSLPYARAKKKQWNHSTAEFRAIGLSGRLDLFG